MFTGIKRPPRIPGGLLTAEQRHRLPDRCLIALVTHSEDTFVPEADFVLKRGDRLTIVGEHDAVREAMALFRGD